MKISHVVLALRHRENAARRRQNPKHPPLKRLSPAPSVFPEGLSPFLHQAAEKPDATRYPRGIASPFNETR
jgi:hypothetical protein